MKAVFAPPEPVLTRQPADQLAIGGENVTLSVAATGTLPLSFQWRLNGTDIPAATNSFLDFSSVQRKDSGSYAVTVTNSAGIASSSNAVLRVLVAQRFLPAQLVNGKVQLRSGDSDGTANITSTNSFELQASTNLTDWTMILTNRSDTNGFLLFNDTTVSTNPIRFFRLLFP
jgi:hypothetical protein